ncbi:hypothetical protein, partial [Bifidobacterium favimelis]
MIRIIFNAAKAQSCLVILLSALLCCFLSSCSGGESSGADIPSPSGSVDASDGHADPAPKGRKLAGSYGEMVDQMFRDDPQMSDYQRGILER